MPYIFAEIQDNVPAKSGQIGTFLVKKQDKNQDAKIVYHIFD
jgi:hypothetical protein